MFYAQHFVDIKKNTSSNNDRFIDFLKFALYRIIETAILYETQAKASKDPTTKLLLYFLAGKKRVQHVILEIIATTNRGKPLPIPNYTTAKSYCNQNTVSLADASYDYIVKYALNRAEKDCNLYSSLAALEEDSSTKKLLLTLSRLSKEFTIDIREGQSKFSQSTSAQ